MECSDLVRKMDLLRQKCIESEEKAETYNCPESNLYYCQYLDYKSELKMLENRYQNDCKGLFSLFVHRLKFGW
jgi:hypothetical protein